MIINFFNFIINEKKSIIISFTTIFGIGISISKKLIPLLGLNHRKLSNISEFSGSQFMSIKNYFFNNFVFDLELKRLLLNEQEKFLELKCYKRNRILLGYPRRGQRTRSNARTVKKISKLK
jgi:small subunit ribosomal protein S13